MKMIIAVIFLVFTIVFGLSSIDKFFNTTTITSTNNSISNIEESSESSADEEETIKVVLIGEVIKPGTYNVEVGQYLEAVIQLAGGITSNADSSCFDYFLVLQEDINLYIPPKTGIEKVSLNYGLLEDFMTLEGIGPSLANAIIEHRNINGEFNYIEQIMDVKGIGKQTFEKNKNMLCL